MANIMLIVHRKAIAQELMYRIRDRPEIKLIYESDYNNASISINNYKAKAALIEVAESGPYDIRYCLALCKKLRKTIPECKLLLMCSEEDEKTVREVVDAKGEKLIDDFVFYDVTIDYLLSKLTSI